MKEGSLFTACQEKGKRGRHLQNIGRKGLACSRRIQGSSRFEREIHSGGRSYRTKDVRSQGTVK